MAKTKATRYSAEEKTKILKRHLLEKEKLSSLCDEFGVTLKTYYNWQQKLFDHATEILKSKPSGRSPVSTQEERIKELEAKLVHKDQVLAEAVEALVLAKKHSGETSPNVG